MKKLSFLFAMLLSFSLAFGQEGEKITNAHVSNYRDWSVSLGVANTYMNGDMASMQTEDDFKFELGPTLNLDLTKYVTPVIGFNLNMQTGTMAGSIGAPEYPRFESFFIDVAPHLTLNLSNLALKGKIYDRKWAHILMFGGGFTFNQPTLFLDENTEIDVGNDGFNNGAFLSLQYRLKYRLSKAWDLDLLAGGRWFINDNIDAWGEGIPENAGGRTNDASLFAGLGVTYNFGNTKTKGKEIGSVVYTNPLDEIYADVEEVKENYDQLTTDDDGDGVSNMFDEDNSTPEGAVVSGDGKAIDSDEDGIPDYLDEDPFTPKGAKVDETGRAIDSDGDGVHDAMDEEPNTPQGALVNFKGQEIKNNTGGGIASLPNVYFNFNSANITGANHYRMADRKSVV